jgi:hypothetical protein
MDTKAFAGSLIRKKGRFVRLALVILLESVVASTSLSQVSEAPQETGPKAPPFSFPPLPKDAPAPPSDPRDFQGVWVHEGMPARLLKTDQGDGLPYLPPAQAIVDHRKKLDAQGTPAVNPSSLCRPPGLLWDFELNFPFVVAQGPHDIVFVFEEFHSIWRVLLEPHDAANIPISYEGYSVGHWEGNTLVVRTTNVRADTWLDISGSPHSANALFEHRIRKVRGDQLEIQLTVTDPAMYNRPWSITRVVTWRPDMRLLGEFNCEESIGSVSEAQRYHVYEDPQK